MSPRSLEDRRRAIYVARFHNLVGTRGGAFTAQELAKLLNRPLSEIIELACARQLICFKGRHAEWFFPKAQFRINAELIDGVGKVLAAFRNDISERDVVTFFLSNYQRTERTPLALIKQNPSYLQCLIDSAETLFEPMAR